MRFFTQQHRFYADVDIHARTISLCVLDAAGSARMPLAASATSPPPVVPASVGRPRSPNLCLGRLAYRDHLTASLWNGVSRENDFRRAERQSRCAPSPIAYIC
jgi:hypothetical protein